MVPNESREVLPYHQNRRPPRNELATVSFVFGLLSCAPIIVGWVIDLVDPLFFHRTGGMVFCCSPLFAVLAVLFGIVADSRILASKDSWRNRWMAVTGFLLGTIVLIISCILLATIE